jgi:hypothetical protein
VRGLLEKEKIEKEYLARAELERKKIEKEFRYSKHFK